MANNTIGASIKLEGEKEYRQAISNINAQMKELDSQMKLTKSQFEGQQNSVEFLTQKDKILTQQIEKQKEKVEALRNALKESTEKYGENDTKTIKWKTSLNDAETKLNKLDTELQKNKRYLDEAESSTDKTAKSIDGYGKEVQEAESKTTTFGSVLKANLTSEAIVAGVKALANGIKQIGSAVVDTVKDTAAYADEILTLSNNTGIATDTLQELKYMEELTDVSLETLTSSMARNIRSMNSAREGTGTAAAAYKALGISVVDANGNLRDSEEVFWETIDALGNMTNETERDATSMTLFGKSAQDLNSVIKIGSAGVAEFAKEARDMGAVLDIDTLKKLGEADDAFKRMEQQLEITKRELGIAFAPAVTRGAQRVTEAIDKLGDKAEKAGNKLIDGVVDAMVFLIDNFDVIIAGVKAVGVGFAAWKITGLVQNAITSFKALMTTLKGVETAQKGVNVAMNANPIGLVVTAVSMLVALLPDIISAFDEWTDAGANTKETLEQIKQATDENVAASGALKDALEDGVSSADAQAVVLENYLNMLGECVDENGNLVEGEEARADLLLGKLNEALGSEYTLNDLISGQYQAMTQNVKDLIEQQKLKAYMSIYEEEYANALKNESGAYSDLMTSLDAYMAQKQVNDAIAARGVAIPKSEIDALKELEEEYQANAAAYQSYVDTQSVYEQALLYSSEGNYSAAMQVMSDYANGYELTGDALARSNEKLANNSIKLTQHYVQTLGLTGEQVKTVMSGVTANMDVTEQMNAVANNLATSFGNKFESSWSYFTARVPSMASAIPDTFRRILGIHSPSKVFTQLGQFTAEGFQIGLNEGFEGVDADLQNLVNGSIADVQGATANIQATNVYNSTDYSGLLKTILNVLTDMEIVNVNNVQIGDQTLERTISRLNTNRNFRQSEG